jgi:hypothetical protein
LCTNEPKQKKKKLENQIYKVAKKNLYTNEPKRKTKKKKQLKIRSIKWQKKVGIAKVGR